MKNIKKNNPLSMSAVAKRRSNLLVSEIDGEAVMLDVTSGKYFNLNVVGNSVWQHIESPKTISSICQNICDQYAVDSASCEADVARFVGELVDSGIVEIA
jgi:hypothetical protein